MTGIEYLQKFEPRKALPILRKALKREPSFANLINLAAAERGCGLILEARETLTRALGMNDKSPEVWNNLGQVATDLGMFKDAPQIFQKCLELMEARGTPPHLAGEPLLAFAYSMMRLGHFEPIWPVWETARLNHSWWPFQGLHPWQGEPDARLLILPEGGFGDGFNFLRWVPLLKVRSATVLVWDAMFEYTKHTLGRILPFLEILPLSHAFQYSDLRKFTHCAPYLSLMRGMKTWSDIPAPLTWEPRSKRGPTEDWIGFCWRAEENGVMRKIRSLDDPAADKIAKHLSFTCERVVSLCPQGKELHRKGDFRTPRGVTQDDAMLDSWEPAALTITRCRLVITVDTAVFHLAGSLGVPTLCILPLRSDWKFGVGPSEATEFYGSNVKLVRNDKPAEWNLQKILEAIDKM
jgi:hypothetical protein